MTYSVDNSEIVVERHFTESQATEISEILVDLILLRVSDRIGPVSTCSPCLEKRRTT